MYIYVWATKHIILKKKGHAGYLSNGTHTVMMYQHFCGECPVHLGIHIVVILYKLVIPVGVILGVYRDEQRHHLEDI